MQKKSRDIQAIRNINVEILRSHRTLRKHAYIYMIWSNIGNFIREVSNSSRYVY